MDNKVSCFKVRLFCLGFVVVHVCLCVFLSPSCASTFFLNSYFLVPIMNPNGGCTTQEIRLVCAPSKPINPVKSNFTLFVGELKVCGCGCDVSFGVI